MSDNQSRRSANYSVGGDSSVPYQTKSTTVEISKTVEAACDAGYVVSGDSDSVLGSHAGIVIVALGGLVPVLSVDSAIVAVGIFGVAVHITLITMRSYAMRARGWTGRDYGLATFDVGASVLVAFGLYSVAIFPVAASVLSDLALTTVSAATALGAFIGGEVLSQLVLALGTVGTLFAIAVVLSLANSGAVPTPTSTLANLSGLALFVLSGSLAVNFLVSQRPGSVGVLTGLVLAFGAVLGPATLGLAGKYGLEELARAGSRSRSRRRR